MMKCNKQINVTSQSLDSVNFNRLRVAMIGGTGGIGRALSRLLASRGAYVSVVGQTFRDADFQFKIDFIQADLSSMREAQRIAIQLSAETLDMVIFTTGIFAAPKRQETSEGIERDMAVSYLNRLVILNSIAPILGAQRANDKTKPRVFSMAYPGSGQIGTVDDLNSEKSYKAMSAHMNTVAGNEMLVLDIAKRFPKINIFGLNPGLIKTNIRDNMLGKDSLKSRALESLIGLFTPRPDEYARRIAPLLLSQDIESYSGAMFNNKVKAILPTEGLSTDYINQYMKASRDLVAEAGVIVASV